MSLSAARVICMGCSYEEAMYFHPIQIRYEFPDGRSFLSSRERGWCENCVCICDREPSWAVSDLLSEFRSVSQEHQRLTTGLGGAFRALVKTSRLIEVSGKLESLTLQLEIASQHQGRQHCLSCGDDATHWLGFGDDGLSSFQHGCGARLKYIAPEEEGPRFSFALTTYRLSPAGIPLGDVEKN